MRRQKNMFQTEKQDKIPEKELKEMEINYLLDKEFKVIAHQTLQNSGSIH